MNDTLSLILSRIEPDENGPVWPEVWHEALKLKYRFFISGTGRTSIVHEDSGNTSEIYPTALNGLKLIAKSFTDLCEEVRENPHDNAAVRAANISAKNSPWDMAVITDDGDIGICYQGDIYGTISPEWGVFNLLVCLFFFQSLIREGYAVGLPEGSFITPKELEDLK